MWIPAQLTHIENYSIHISHFEKKNFKLSQFEKCRSAITK